MLGSILLSVAAAYVIMTVAMVIFQDRLVYFPTRALTLTPRDWGLNYEEVSLITEDNLRLHGWFVPTPQARAVLLYFHGNAGNLSHRLESIALFHRLRLSVFIIDYRGYGRSQGKPSEQGTYRDAMAAWRHLIEVRGYQPRDVVLFGRSLGAAVAAWLAAQTTPRALIIESVFTSMPELGQELYPWLPVRWLARFHYPVKDYVRQIKCPVLVVHSRQDEIIPFHHGEALYGLASSPKHFLELEGGHNEAFVKSGRKYVEGLDIFLRAVLTSG